MTWVNDFTEMLFSLDPQKINVEGAYILKAQHLPASIFKYYRVTKHSLQNFEENKVWLTNPRKLNDPYDCAVSVNHDHMMNEGLRTLRAELAKMSSNKLSGDAIAKIVESNKPLEMLMDQWFEIEPAEKIEDQKNAIRQIFKFINEMLDQTWFEDNKNAFKICSFSERVDSTIMWAHYAHYHKGFCIEYDIRSLPIDDYRSRFLYPIIYSDRVFEGTEHFIRTVRDEQLNDLYLNMAGLIKAADWSYEKEWRLLFANEVMKDEQAYPMPKPKAVYLGSHIKTKDQQMLIDICDKQKIQVLKMKRSIREFLMVPCSIKEADEQLTSHEFIKILKYVRTKLRQLKSRGQV